MTAPCESFTITPMLDEMDGLPVFEVKTDNGNFATNVTRIEDAFDIIRKGIRPAMSLEEIAKDWMYSHGQAVLDDMGEDIAEEYNITDLQAGKVVDLIERATITIEFD